VRTDCGRRMGALATLALALAGCRSASEGYAGGDIARVRAEVARRAGTAPPSAVPYGPEDGGLVPECAPLLSKSLDQETAVKVALLNNRSVRESYERLGIARADLLQAGLVTNPVFSANAKFFSRGPEIELGLLQSFVDLFFVPLRRRVAAAELCAAEAAVARDLVRLVYDVRRAFVTAHAARELVVGRTEVLRSATAQRDLMKSLHDAGNVLDSQWTLAQAGASRAQLDLAAALALEREAREPINVLLGLKDDAVAWTLEGTLDAMPSEVPEARDAVSRAVASSLDLVENRAQIEAAAMESGLRRREGLLPEFELGAVGKRENDGPWGFGPEISTAIPIFDQGQAKVLEANAHWRQRMARHVVLTVRVQSAARQLRDRAVTLRERVRSLRVDYLPLRARLVRETLQQYNAMQVGAFEVLTAQQQEAEALREHVETLREAWTARLDLEELLAGSFNGGRVDGLHMPEPAEQPAAQGVHTR
jgi:cobalt-zinc-cadmium efflux system outer membrane protein